MPLEVLSPTNSPRSVSRSSLGPRLELLGPAMPLVPVVSASLRPSVEKVPVTRSTLAGSFARPTTVERQDGLFQRLSSMEREVSTPKLLSPKDQAASNEELIQLITGETTAFGGPFPTITGAEMQSAIPALRNYPNVASVIANISNQGTKPLVDFPRTLPGAAMAVAAPSAGLTGLAGVAGKTVLGKFIWDALQHTPQLVQDTENAIRSGDPGRIAGAITGLTLNSTIAIGASRGLKKTLAREGIQQTPLGEVLPTQTETFSSKGTFKQFVERSDVDIASLRQKPVVDLQEGAVKPVVEQLTQKPIAETPKAPELMTEHEWNVAVQEMLERVTLEAKAETAKAPVEMTVERFPDGIKVSGITVPKEAQGKGLGTQAMKVLIAESDATGKPIYLTASAEAGKQDALNRFYERLGFVQYKTDPLSGKPMYVYRPSKNLLNDAQAIAKWYVRFRNAYNSDNPYLNLKQVLEELPDAKTAKESKFAGSLARGTSTSAVGAVIHENIPIHGEPFGLWRARVLGEFPLDKPMPKGWKDSMEKAALVTPPELTTVEAISRIKDELGEDVFRRAVKFYAESYGNAGEIGVHAALLAKNYLRPQYRSARVLDAIAKAKAEIANELTAGKPAIEQPIVEQSTQRTPNALNQETIQAGTQPERATVSQGGIPSEAGRSDSLQRAASSQETQAVGGKPPVIPSTVPPTSPTEARSAGSPMAMPGASPIPPVIPPTSPPSVPPVPPIIPGAASSGASRGGGPEKTGLSSKLGNWLKAASLKREIIPAAIDTVKNSANLFARETRNSIIDRAKSIVGVWTKQLENALTFVVEAKGDLNALQEMRVKIETSANSAKAGKWKLRALNAITIAENNFPRLVDVAKEFDSEMLNQVGRENAKGIPTEVRSGYVPHIQDLSDVNATLFELGGSRGQGSGGFTHQRTHPTFADSIAAGIKPKELNALDLLEHRLRAGNRRIGMTDFVDALKDVVDPETGNPIFQQPTTRVQQLPTGPGRTETIVPIGYHLKQIGGSPIAVHKAYSGLIENLTGESAFALSGTGRVIMNSAGVAKHVLLMFDFFHAVRLAVYSKSVQGLKGLRSSYGKGLQILENDEGTLRAMTRRGEIPEAYLPEILEKKRIVNLGVKTGFNVGRINDALYTEFVRAIPLLGQYNRWLFDSFQRGLMAETYVIQFRREAKQFPNKRESEIARNVSKNLNVRFGNLMSQSWIKNKTFTDLLRLVFLAPQWNEGLIRSELGGLRQFGKVPIDAITKRRLIVGALGRSMGTIFATYFLGNQVINYLTRGKPTWENEDDQPGAKISAWIPDILGKESEGFFLNPLSLSAELIHQVANRAEQTHSIFEGLNNVLDYKLGPIGKTLNVLRTGKDWRGKPLDDWERVQEAFLAGLPIPIQAPAIYQAIRGQESFPGQAQKSLMGSLGFKSDTKKSSFKERVEQATTLPLEKSSIKERAQAIKSFPERPMREPSSKLLGTIKAAKAQEKRDTYIQKRLTEEAQVWLDQNKLSWAGFGTVVEDQERIPLTDKEETHYRQLVSTGYNEAIKRLMDDDTFEGQDQAKKQSQLNLLLKRAKQRARKELEQVVEEGKLR